MINRREFFGITASAGVTLALTPELLRAFQQQGGKLIQRAIPSTGEMLPVIGVQFGNFETPPPSSDHHAFKEVLKTLVDNGGRVLDTTHGGSIAEQLTGTLANELGIQNKIFWSTKVNAPFPLFDMLLRRLIERPPSKVTPPAARAQIETSFVRFKVPGIDLMQVRPFDDVPTYLAVLRELKAQGRVRYIGVTAAFDNQYADLESIMRKEPIDFISIDYAVDNRNVEQTILPLAQERKIGVLANFPFGQNQLFQRAGTTPLPTWAADFDARTWAQFFLKYVISHSAVTAVRVGTSKAKHMLDNIGGGIGRLPNEATRKRMIELV